MKKKIYYKVVSVDKKGRLHSCFIRTTLLNEAYRVKTTIFHSKLDVIYKVGEEVVPYINGTRLCVFGSLEEAKRYIYDQQIVCARIYTCHARKVMKLPQAISGIAPIQKEKDGESLVELWREWIHKTYHFPKLDWFGAIGVTLIEEVK